MFEFIHFVTDKYSLKDFEYETVHQWSVLNPYAFWREIWNYCDIIYSKKGYGTHIIVKHRFGFQTLYGHLDKVLARKGQKVKQHELIATVGNSGSSTGYHLHYETIKNEIKIDPRPSLNLKKSIYGHLIQLNQ